MSKDERETSPAAKRRALAVLVLAVVSVKSLWFSASAVVPQLAEEWALSGSGKAWLTTSVQLGFVAGALASAVLNLADRVSPRWIFGVSAIAAAACNAGIATGVGPGATLALRFFTGALLAGVYPPGMKLAASWSRRDRGLVIGMLVGALTLGSALPHLLNALGPSGMPPWRTVLLAASGLAVFGGVLVPLCVPEGPHAAGAAPFDARFAVRVFTERPLRLANLGYLGHMWELYAMWTWVPLALMASYQQAGWSPAGARVAGFGSIAIGAVGSVCAGLWADRVGRTRVTIASLALSGACCLASGWLVHSPGWLTALCLVWGFAVVADSAQFSAAVSELADPRYVGTALTMQTSLGFLLTIVTVGAAPRLLDAFGWSGVFPMLALGPVVGIVAMARLRALPEAERMASGRR